MERNDQLYEYQTVNLTLDKNGATADKDVRIPDGEIIAIGAKAAVDAEEIIDLSLLDNNNEVLRPADYRFSEKTNGGTWIDSMRPVNITGGRTLTARLSAYTGARADDFILQIVFCIAKNI